MKYNTELINGKIDRRNYFDCDFITGSRFPAEMLKLFDSDFAALVNLAQIAEGNADIALDKFAANHGFNSYYGKDFEVWLDNEATAEDINQYNKLVDSLTKAEDAEKKLESIEKLIMNVISETSEVEFMIYESSHGTLYPLASEE